MKILSAKLNNENQHCARDGAASASLTYALTIPRNEGQGKMGAGDTVDVDYDLAEQERDFFTGLDHLQESPTRISRLIQNKR